MSYELNQFSDNLNVNGHELTVYYNIGYTQVRAGKNTCPDCRKKVDELVKVKIVINEINEGHIAVKFQSKLGKSVITQLNKEKGNQQWICSKCFHRKS